MPKPERFTYKEEIIGWNKYRFTYDNGVMTKESKKIRDEALEKVRLEKLKRNGNTNNNQATSGN